MFVCMCLSTSHTSSHILGCVHANHPAATNTPHHSYKPFHPPAAGAKCHYWRHHCHAWKQTVNPADSRQGSWLLPPAAANTCMPTHMMQSKKWFGEELHTLACNRILTLSHMWHIMLHGPRLRHHEASTPRTRQQKSAVHTHKSTPPGIMTDSGCFAFIPATCFGQS